MLETQISEVAEIEIITPKRLSYTRAIICDCCRELKRLSEFGVDSFGICEACLGSDSLAVGVGLSTEEN